MAEHPMQSVILDEDGTARFKANKIVEYLQSWATLRGMDMNALAIMPFDREDREQFAQLIGYSVSGFGELSYASDEAVDKADRLVEQLLATK